MNPSDRHSASGEPDIVELDTKTGLTALMRIASQAQPTLKCVHAAT